MRPMLFVVDPHFKRGKKAYMSDKDGFFYFLFLGHELPWVGLMMGNQPFCVPWASPTMFFLLEEDDHPNWRMVLHKEAQAKVWKWRGPCRHMSTRNPYTNTGFGGSGWVVDFPCHYGKRAIEEMNGLCRDLARCKGQPQKATEMCACKESIPI